MISVAGGVCHSASAIEYTNNWIRSGVPGYGSKAASTMSASPMILESNGRYSFRHVLAIKAETMVGLVLPVLVAVQ